MEQQMYKVQIDGEERSFPAGTTYLQIAGEYQERYPHDIVLVYVNGKLQELGKKLIIQVAPSVRITLAEALGEKPGVVSTGRLVSALKRLGFYKVFDSDFSADLTIMEEGTELLHRLKNGGTLPMITSCCPAWVKYCETYAPNLTDHLSTAKSPQQMFGAMIKTWFA